MTNHRYALPFFLLGLAACAPLPPRPPATAATPQARPTPPHETADARAPQNTPPAATPPAAKTERPAQKAPAAKAPASASAVLALLQEAEASAASGSLDEAAATLERAIRLQPRDARLWHKLAEVRLRQQQPGLAEDLAKKSNIHCQDDKALTRQNWALIGQARRKKGDEPGAAEADAKAGR